VEIGQPSKPVVVGAGGVGVGLHQCVSAVLRAVAGGSDWVGHLQSGALLDPWQDRGLAGGVIRGQDVGQIRSGQQS